MSLTPGENKRVIFSILLWFFLVCLFFVSVWFEGLAGRRALWQVIIGAGDNKLAVGTGDGCGGAPW